MALENLDVTSQLELYIQEIAKNLMAGQACVMVGAGFSRNADSSGKQSELPAWKNLGDIFYKRLHGGKSKGNIIDLFETQKLAEEIENNFERTVLDKLIEDSIPDLDFKPSDLHQKLIQLPWRDIFTTNYDRFLERAAEITFADRKYQTIINEKDLRLSHSPRIIKLHGSFTGGKPYIITESDYKTYPENHQLFVTNVKNSLVENVFYLIGFSGNDPNFLSWINWLQEGLGTNYSPKFYFIGVSISNDETESLKAKHIEPIDIAHICKIVAVTNPSLPIAGTTPIPITADYGSPYRKLFDMIARECNKTEATIKPIPNDNYPPKWPDEKYISFYSEKDLMLQYKSLIAAWKLTRENYPGWIVLSDERRHMLKRNTDDAFIYHLKNIDESVDLEFLYEFNWRLEKYYHPLVSDWATTYKTVIDKYDLSSKAIKNKHLRACWLELQLALLKYYRQESMGIEWKQLEKNIENTKNSLSAEQLEKYNCERCMNHLFSLDLPKLREELKN
jgi:hypothetical protein